VSFQWFAASPSLVDRRRLQAIEIAERIRGLVADAP
jgi:hypothetical protein